MHQNRPSISAYNCHQPFNRYQEWIEQKKKTDELQHALEVEQQKLKELELKDKKEKSDAAFKSWLEKSMQRVRSAPHSYAKCDGTITGITDADT